MTTEAAALEAAAEPAATAPRSDALADRPPLSAPPTLQAPDVRESVLRVAARQPALGLAGLLLVAPVALALGAGAGGLEPSLRVLGPLSTFGLPVVAMIAFWWEDWPGTQLKPPLSGLLDTILVIVGAVLLTLLGQLVVGHLDLRGIFDPTPGLGHSATFPATMPLAGAFFVVTLQLTLVSEGWPVRRLGRIPSGPIALAVAWALAVTLYLLLVKTHPKPGSGLYARSGGALAGAEFGAVLTAIGLWQVCFYIALRGWPFSAVASRPTRLLTANITVIAAGVLSYAILHTAIGLGPSTTTAVTGSLLTAVLLRGMLFEGLPRSPDHPARERALTSGIVVLLGAGLYGALNAIAHQAHWTTAAPEQWVAYAGLNAIGLGVILHVAIGRRWPFATGSETLR
jgi:hypothetical protein